MNVIEINDVSKDYGNHKGIFHVSFDVRKGEVFGFLGPNGAGKTTTIRHLLGFIYATHGSCTISGMDCGTQAAEIQKTLGYIPGEITLMNEMTGIQFLHFMADYRGMKDFSKAEELMKRFALDPKGKIKRMSKGMKQKLGIIVAFMHDPEVLILDEPTSGLDPLMQNEFVDLVLEEKKRGKTILMSSHMFEEVEKTCDRVGIIKDGEMVRIDHVHALQESRLLTYRVTLKQEADMERFQQEMLQIKKVRGKEASVIVTRDVSSFIHILDGYEIERLDVEHQSLEEIFMQFYGGNDHV